ncbi:recombinase family protein [Sphingobium sp. BHU LFT2]|uniref:recombinase family protein n=1 Tax=Sphingobium sp. BHU LFT2 TaxID=2807634 RepID=UPI001BE6B1DD|nr:recombinase family protein [Sphingobium sp. BHU LFT2]MBT2246312.1 recombinase family protein [Sphingobium sp. BHU LFT2]
MSGRLIGYARASLTAPPLAEQEGILRAAGCVEIFTDTASEVPARRFAGRRQAIAALSEGDTLVVARLDRLARSLPDLVGTIWSVICLRCGFTALEEDLRFQSDEADDAQSTIGIIAAAAKAIDAEIFAETEARRSLPRGRKHELTDSDWPKVEGMLGTLSLSEVAKQLGISRPTLRRFRDRMSGTSETK